MRYYQDIQPGETLQAGDERLCIVSLTWSPINMSAVGLPVSLANVYRRPVDLPTLQPVTPEAIRELEGEEARTIAVLSQASAKTMAWLPSLGYWLSRAGHDSPLEWQWFIDLSTIPEVTT